MPAFTFSRYAPYGCASKGLPLTSLFEQMTSRRFPPLSLAPPLFFTLLLFQLRDLCAATSLFKWTRRRDPKIFLNSPPLSYTHTCTLRCKKYIYKKQDRGEGRKKGTQVRPRWCNDPLGTTSPLKYGCSDVGGNQSVLFTQIRRRSWNRGLSHKNKLVSVFNTFYHNKMSKSEVEFVPVPESCTVRRVVVAASAGRSSRRRRCNINNTCCNRTSSSLIHLTSRKFFSWKRSFYFVFSCGSAKVADE